LLSAEDITLIQYLKANFLTIGSGSIGKPNYPLDTESNSSRPIHLIPGGILAYQIVKKAYRLLPEIGGEQAGFQRIWPFVNCWTKGYR
jgi:hypothetical protein